MSNTSALLGGGARNALHWMHRAIVHGGDDRPGIAMLAPRAASSARWTAAAMNEFSGMSWENRKRLFSETAMHVDRLVEAAPRFSNMRDVIVLRSRDEGGGSAAPSRDIVGFVDGVCVERWAVCAGADGLGC